MKFGYPIAHKIWISSIFNWSWWRAHTCPYRLSCNVLYLANRNRLFIAIGVEPAAELLFSKTLPAFMNTGFFSDFVCRPAMKEAFFALPQGSRPFTTMLGDGSKPTVYVSGRQEARTSRTELRRYPGFPNFRVVLLPFFLIGCPTLPPT